MHNRMNTGRQNPIIRPGQRKPYTKGTAGQQDTRRGIVARLLANGLTKTAIHRVVRQKFGVEWRQCDRYIRWLAKVKKAP